MDEIDARILFDIKLEKIIRDNIEIQYNVDEQYFNNSIYYVFNEEGFVLKKFDCLTPQILNYLSMPNVYLAIKTLNIKSAIEDALIVLKEDYIRDYQNYIINIMVKEYIEIYQHSEDEVDIELIECLKKASIDEIIDIPDLFENIICNYIELTYDEVYYKDSFREADIICNLNDYYRYKLRKIRDNELLLIKSQDDFYSFLKMYLFTNLSIKNINMCFFADLFSSFQEEVSFKSYIKIILLYDYFKVLNINKEYNNKYYKLFKNSSLNDLLLRLKDDEVLLFNCLFNQYEIVENYDFDEYDLALEDWGIFKNVAFIDKKLKLK